MKNLEELFKDFRKVATDDVSTISKLNSIYKQIISTLKNTNNKDEIRDFVEFVNAFKKDIESGTEEIPKTGLELFVPKFLDDMLKEAEYYINNNKDNTNYDPNIGGSSEEDNSNNSDEHVKEVSDEFDVIIDNIDKITDEFYDFANNLTEEEEDLSNEQKQELEQKRNEVNRKLNDERQKANKIFIREKENVEVMDEIRKTINEEKSLYDDEYMKQFFDLLYHDTISPMTNNSENINPSEGQNEEEKYNYPFAPVSEYKEETFEELDERMKELKYRYNKAKRENDEENMSLYADEFKKIQEYLNNKNNRLKAFNKSDMKAMDKFAMVGLIDLEKAVNIKNEKKSYSTYTKGVDTALNVDTLEEYLQNNPNATLKIKKKTWKRVALTIIAAGLTLGLITGAVKGINKLKNTIDGLYTSDTNDKDNIKDKNKDTQSADANIQENPTEEKTTEEQVEEAIAAIEESSKEENNEIVSSNDSDIPLAKDKKANNDKILLDDYDYSNSNDGNSDYVLVDNNGGSTPSSPLSDNGTPSSPTSNTNETQSNDNLSNNTQETIIPEADAAEEPEAQEYKNITEKTGMEFTYNGAMALEIEINNSTPTNESDDMPIEGQDDHNQPKDEQQAQDSDYKIPAQEIINDGGTINNRIPVNQDESMPIEGEDNNVQPKDEQQAQGSDYTIPEQEIVTEDQLEEHSETPNANQDMPIEGEEQSQLEQTAEEKDSESKDSSEENNDFKLIQYEEDKSEEKIVEEQAADEGEPIDFVGDSLEDYINIISTEEKVNYEEQNENGTYNTDNLEIDENTYILTLTPNN